MSKNGIRSFFESMIDKPSTGHVQGFSSWLGGIIREVGDDTLTLEVTVRPDMCNPVGTLHGGVHAAILDEVVGMAVAAMENESHFVTLNFTTDIFRPARAGDVVRAKAEIVKKGRKAIHVIASMKGSDGKELSRCTQNMMSIG
jgi:acyl-coenzyme A thioesterase 13